MVTTDQWRSSDLCSAWFDGLDLPLACSLDARFFEFYPTGELGGGGLQPTAPAGKASLFSITDAPVLRALGLERILGLDAPQEITGDFA